VPPSPIGTLGDGIAVDKLSVGRDKGVAVETTPACTEKHADNERDRRQIEMRIRLKNNLGRIGHLFYIVIYRLFIIAEQMNQIAGRVFNFFNRAGAQRSSHNVYNGSRLNKVPIYYYSGIGGYSEILSDKALLWQDAC